MNEQLAPEYTPADHLAALEEFLDTTSRAINDQAALLRDLGPLVDPQSRAHYVTQLGLETVANVQAICMYVESLATAGLRFAVQYDMDTYPLTSVRLNPNTGQYTTPIHTPQGPQLVPLNGSLTIQERGTSLYRPLVTGNPLTPTGTMRYNEPHGQVFSVVNP